MTAFQCGFGMAVVLRAASKANAQSVACRPEAVHR